MYAVVVEKANIKKEFSKYNEARHFMAECKKNWEAQINAFENWQDDKRAFLCELYWTVKIEKI